MNPHGLSASDLLVWGIVAHLVADWPLQSRWMVAKKTSLLHPAAYIHAGIHGIVLSFVFGWAAIPLAVAHLLIDTRKPVQWWSKLVLQTQPQNRIIYTRWHPGEVESFPQYDMGLEVFIWTDQVFHIICIAVAALLIA